MGHQFAHGGVLESILTPVILLLFVERAEVAAL